MDRLLIRGGRRLNGEVTISGAKNAALPELCAALLTAEPVRLANVPRLQDVNTMLHLLRKSPFIRSTRARPWHPWLAVTTRCLMHHRRLQLSQTQVEPRTT